MFLDSLAAVGVLVFLIAIVAGFRRNRTKQSFLSAVPTHAGYAGLVGTLWLLDSYGSALVNVVEGYLYVS